MKKKKVSHSNLYPISDSQWKQLLYLLQYVKKNSAYYKQKLNSIDNLSTKKLSKSDFYNIPFLSRNELGKDQKNNPPLGHHFSTPKMCTYIRTTSGTTGVPLIVPFSTRDHGGNVQLSIEFFKKIGIKKSDKYYGVFTPGTYLAIFDAIKTLGATPITYNMNPGSQILRVLKSTNATVLHSTAGMLHHIVDVAEKTNFNLKSLSLRMVVAGGEIITALSRNKIEKQFGVPYKTGYFATEIGTIAVGCPYNKDEVVYHPLTKGCIFEVVNARNKHSDKGEMILTALTRYDYPFIRYKTGNLVKVVSKKCKCRDASISFTSLGRSDNTIRFRAQYFRPNDFELLLKNTPGIKDFRMVLGSTFGSEYLLVKIIPDISNITQVKNNVFNNFVSEFGIQPVIEIIPFKSFDPSPWKKKLLVDERYQTPPNSSQRSGLLNFNRVRLIVYWRLIKPLLDLISR